MKIIFAGTPEFAVPALEKLIATHDVMAVFTQPDRRSGRGKKMTPPPVKTVAQKHSIPVFQPMTLKDQQSVIADLKPDVMVVVAYGMLLPAAILEIPRLGCLNIHASLLPRWRGAAPIQRAIEAMDVETGVSIMQMELGLDTGPVYQMLHTPILDTDTSASMHEKLADLGATGIEQTLNRLQSDADFSPQAQDDQLACYAKKLVKSEADIDWHRPAIQIHAQIRAFNPWPVCQTWHRQSRLRIWASNIVELAKAETPGTIMHTDAGGLVVACGENGLSLGMIQKDGSKPMAASEFLNGYSIEAGDRLQLKPN